MFGTQAQSLGTLGRMLLRLTSVSQVDANQAQNVSRDKAQMEVIDRLDPRRETQDTIQVTTPQEKCCTTNLLSDCGGETKVNNVGPPGWLNLV